MLLLQGGVNGKIGLCTAAIMIECVAFAGRSEWQDWFMYSCVLLLQGGANGKIGLCTAAVKDPNKISTRRERYLNLMKENGAKESKLDKLSSECLIKHHCIDLWLFGETM